MHPMKTVAISFLPLMAVSPFLAQEFQIRTVVDLVVVPFSVTGDNNALISGLGAEDFTVLEDGVEQSIERFSIDPVPLSAAVVIDTGVAATRWSRSRRPFQLSSSALPFGRSGRLPV